MAQRIFILAISTLAIVLVLFRLASNAEIPDTSTFFLTSTHKKVSALRTKLEHAELLWRQSVEDRETMAVQSGFNREFPDGYIYPYHVWDFARPSFYCPHDLERVGTLGDGGKVVCGMTRYEAASPGPSSDTNTAPELIVYSFGVNDDSSFEAALLERTNARIWGYDYSVNSWAKEIPRQKYSRAEFSQLGLGKTTNHAQNPPMSTIQDLMRENGHSYVDIVKMDIEGAEFDVLTSLIDSVLENHESPDSNATMPFGQLLVEIHFMPEPPGFSIPKNLRAWMSWWSSLEEMGLRPVNNEDNWIGDVGTGKPRFMEYTLINTYDRKANKLLWD
jgi:hypothetical protein